MEIKELINNSGLQNLLTKSFSGNMADRILDKNFANMVLKTADSSKGSNINEAFKADAKADVSYKDKTHDNHKSETAKNKKDNVKETEKETRQSKKRKVADGKDTKSETENVSVANTEAKKEVKTADNEVKSSDLSEQPIKANEADNSSVSVEGVSDSTASDSAVSAVAYAVSELSTLANAQNVVAIQDGEKLISTLPSLDINALAQKPEVSVFDKASNQLVTMSGAELVSLIEQKANQGNMLGIIGEDLIQNISASVTAELVNPIADLGEESQITDILQVADVDSETAQNSEQSKIIAAKADLQNNMQVEVKVENEDSVVSNDKILADEVAVEGTLASDNTAEDVALADSDIDAILHQKAQVKSATVEKMVSEEKSAEQKGNLVNKINNVDANLNLNDNSQAIASFTTANIAQNTKTVTVNPTAVETVSSLDSASNIANNAVLGANVEAQSKPVANPVETSFRDIYKGMDREVVEQVKVNITKSAVKGVDKIEIKLHPEDLGHIEIKMQIAKGGKLQAHIVASNADTLDILQREIGNLEKAFNDAGFQTDAGSLSFSFRGEEQNSQAQRHDTELRNFIGNAFEQEAENELAGNDNLSSWDSLRGLNIRV